MNEKRGQPLEPFPFQSSKSWTRSFLASRLPARIFPLVLPFQAIPLFLRFQGSLSLSFSHGHYHRRRAPLLMVFSRRSNSSFCRCDRFNKSGQFLSYFDLNYTHTIQLSVTSLHLQRWIAPNGSSPNLSNIDSPILIYTRSSIFTDDFRFPRIDDLLSPRLLTRDNPIDPRRSSHERK